MPTAPPPDRHLPTRRAALAFRGKTNLLQAHRSLLDLPHRPATLADLSTARTLVLPAWIEHQPRLALRALANGIPVIATADCGLSPHPLLCQIDEPNAEHLHTALSRLLSQQSSLKGKRAS